MGVEIPFVHEFDFEYGRCDQLSPLIRRVICNNPGAFTFRGTGTYIIGQGELALIDPGPIDEAHLTALLAAIGEEKLTHIFITHTHADHSPLANRLRLLTGAKVMGYKPQASICDDGIKPEAEADTSFSPDQVLEHGDIVKGPGWTIEAVFTPGHLDNHMCYALKEEKALFTGDHVMGWSTSIVSPPEGDMKDYFNSLYLLLDRDDEIYWPTHGTCIKDPKNFVQAYIAHRKEREAQVMSCLEEGMSDISTMVKKVYAAIDERLHPAAARSMLAHLIQMTEDGRVLCDGEPTVSATYRLPQ